MFLRVGVNYLKKILRERGMSEEELAELTGLPLKNIRTLTFPIPLHGGSRIPTPNEKRKISSALGVESTVIFPEDKED